MHYDVVDLVNNEWGNGLSVVQFQAPTWTNGDLSVSSSFGEGENFPFF